MNSVETVNRIINKLIENGWTILSADFTGRYQVKAKKKYSNVSITTEECLCHGGRMWISDEHCKVWKEISHASYDSSLGITDSDSELKYIIDNEMIPALAELGHMVYKVVKIKKGQSGALSEESDYYNSLEGATSALFNYSRTASESIGNDINKLDIGERVVATYPNECVKSEFERIEVPKDVYRAEGRIYVKQIEFSKENKKDEFKEDPSRYGHGTIRYMEVFRK